MIGAASTEPTTQKAAAAAESSRPRAAASASGHPPPPPALLSFGSYRLGVHDPDADVDCLVLAPPHCKREDFFGGWVGALGRMAVDGGRISGLHPVASAYTPVVKFEMDGVKIDMIFASVSDHKWLVERQTEAMTKTLARPDAIDHDDDDDGGAMEEETMRVDDAALIGLDESSVRSVNGVRVAQFLLDAIVATTPPAERRRMDGDEGRGDGGGKDGRTASPDDSPAESIDDVTSLRRLEYFRLTLRLVKAWAKNHGLYANVLGFLGGVNWAILVCWVCERNPDELPSRLLQIFFRTFANWKWPVPVSLSKQQNNPPAGVQPLPTWDPVKNYRDSKHVMPIITPCYPPMNSSYNVGEPQLRRMRDELLRASKLCDNIVNNHASSSCSCWDVLIENDFFKQHANYLQVDVIGTNEEEFRSWFGLCESRMKLLIVGLESPIDGVQAYPHAKFFHRREKKGMEGGIDDENIKYVTSHFVALRFAHTAKRVDLGPLVMDFLQVVNSFEGRKSGMDLAMCIVSKKDLPSYVFADGN